VIINDTFEFSINGDIIDGASLRALSLKILQTVYCKSLYKLTFIDTDVTRWNLIAQSPDIFGSVRMGAVTTEQPTGDWSTWKNFRVTKLDTRISGTQIAVTITGHDIFFDMKNQAPQRSFADKKISEMIEEIVDTYTGGSQKLEAEIVATTGSYNLLQGWATDYDFIMEELLPRARLSSAEDILLFYVKNEKEATKIVLTTLEEKSKGDPKLKFAPNNKDAGGEFDPLNRAGVSTFRAFTEVSKSNYGTDTVGFDPLKELPEPYLVNAIVDDQTTDYVSLGATVLPQPLYSFSAEIQGLVMNNLDLDFETELATRSSWWFTASNRLVATSWLLHKAEIGEIASITAEAVGEQPLFCTGNFLIYGLMHEINKQYSRTYTFLERRGVVQAS